MGKLRRQPLSNGSNIGISYTNMNIMVNGRGFNSTIVDQEGNLTNGNNIGQLGVSL
jgi:hypothetical protein